MSCWTGRDGGADFLRSSGLWAEVCGSGRRLGSVSICQPAITWYPLALGGRAMGRIGKGEEAPSAASTKCSEWDISVGDDLQSEGAGCL